LKNSIKLQLLKEVNDQCQELCTRKKGNTSVLKVEKSKVILEDMKWNDVMVEMKERAPDVLDFIATVAAPKMKKKKENQIPPICSIYSCLMNQRWQELNLIQKLTTVLLGVGHSTKKVFDYKHLCTRMSVKTHSSDFLSYVLMTS